MEADRERGRDRQKKKQKQKDTDGGTRRKDRIIDRRTGEMKGLRQSGGGLRAVRG